MFLGGKNNINKNVICYTFKQIKNTCNFVPVLWNCLKYLQRYWYYCIQIIKILNEKNKIKSRKLKNWQICKQRFKKKLIWNVFGGTVTIVINTFILQCHLLHTSNYVYYYLYTNFYSHYTFNAENKGRNQKLFYIIKCCFRDQRTNSNRYYSRPNFDNDYTLRRSE